MDAVQTVLIPLELFLERLLPPPTPHIAKEKSEGRHGERRPPERTEATRENNNTTKKQVRQAKRTKKQARNESIRKT